MTKRSDQIDMLHGPLLGRLFRFAVPIAASSILQQLFNSADVAVVGRFDSSRALAAVGSNGPVINILVALFIGMAMGANVLIASYIGRHEERKISEAIHTAVSIALLGGLALAVLGQVLARPMLVMMVTPADVLDLAVLYLRIYFFGMPFFLLYNFGAAILRSKGDSKRPLYCLSIAGAINVVLNLILVIVFRMGVAGVAIATVTSNLVSAGLVASFLMRGDEPFRLWPGRLRLGREYLLGIVRIGVPAGLQGMVFSLSNVCILTGINSFGANASAGSATALNFEFIAYFVVNAFTQAAMTFTSQNYSAGLTERCKRIFLLALGLSLSLTALTSAAFLTWRKELLQLYTLDPAVVAFAEVRMMHVVTFTSISSFYEVTGAVLRAMGRSMLPTAIVLLGCCLFRILWLLTAFQVWRSFGMLMNVYPISWTLTSIAMITAYCLIRKRAFELVRKDGREPQEAGADAGTE